MTTQTLNSKAIKTLISLNEGKVFGVTFTKKDGTQRSMNARLGVTAPLKGGENNVAHIPKYLTAYDMQKGNYRNINTETVTELRMGGMTYKIEA